MKKLAYQSQSEVFEKVVTKNGRFFFVRFVVVKRGTRLCGKIISCEEVLSFSPVKDKGLRTKDSRLCFPITKSLRRVKDKGLKIKDIFLSPYFNKFDFLTAIKIRAPSRSAE